MEQEIIALLKETNERLGRIEKLLEPTEIFMEATELSELETTNINIENATIHIGKND